MSAADPEPAAGWSLALELGPDRGVVGGSKAALAEAVGRGADLRVYTEFVFEEHIVPGGNGDPSMDGLIREVIDFRETILVDDRHVGAVTTLRQPLEPPFGFNGTAPEDVVLHVHRRRRAGAGESRPGRITPAASSPASGVCCHRPPTCPR